MGRCHGRRPAGGPRVLQPAQPVQPLLRDGQMTEEINFWTTRCEYGWMSNFYRAGLDIEGVHYPTVEHFYQSSKCTDTADWVAIRDAATPAEAKRLGQTASMRWDWERVKVRVMRKALRAKFAQNPALGRMLLATGDAAIHEDSPTD